MRYYAKLKSVVIASGVLVVLGWLLLAAVPSLAAAGQIYVSPATSSVKSGSNLTVSLRIDPKSTVDGVQATVGYDSTKLQFVSIDNSTSAFPVQLQQTTATGSITIARGDLGGTVSSDALIVTITLKALASSGSSTLTISNANATYAGNYTNPTTANGTVSFTTQTVTPPPVVTPTPTTTPATGTGSNSPTTTVRPTTTPTTNTAAKPPAITVAVKDVQFTLVTLGVSSDTPVAVYAKYGVDGALNLSTTATSLATSHDISLDSNLLLPGTTYSYSIVATDQVGGTTQSPVATLKTKGYTLSVKVLDQAGQPLRNKTVELHSTPVTAKTNNQGVATFSDVAPGNHQVIYTAGGKSYSQAVTVQDEVALVDGVQTAATQNAAVTLPKYQQSGISGFTIVLTLGTLLLLGGLVFIMRGRLGRKEPQPIYSMFDPDLMVSASAIEPPTTVPPPQPPSSPLEVIIPPQVTMPPAPPSSNQTITPTAEPSEEVVIQLSNNEKPKE